jgi:hypothetical protein
MDLISGSHFASAKFRSHFALILLAQNFATLNDLTIVASSMLRFAQRSDDRDA